MMGTPEDARTRAAKAYNAAADHYDDAANAFWVRFGRRTVERLHLSAGARVLDVCCGSGASAIPAAEAVGPEGWVLGVDLADDLLALGRAKARQRELDQLEFRAGDLLDLRLPGGTFDAVVCVFGIFFVPDMEAAARELWRLVRPGGQLAITTWGARFFEPMNTVFWDAVRAEAPNLHKGFNPWDRIAEPEALAALLERAGVPAPAVFEENGVHTLTAPEDWWSMALGTGYRGTLDQLEAGSRERVRRNNLEYLRRTGLAAVEANVIYAVTTKGVAGGG